MQVSVLQRYAKILALTSGLFMVAGASVAQTAGNGVLGWWLDQTGNGGILISKCGNSICGKIEWLRTPLDAQGKPVQDGNNDNAALRSRQICGLQLLGNFVPDGSGGWKNGWIYDPTTGKTYSSVVSLDADGTLDVRGYVGAPFFGQSQTWTRPASTLTPCTGG